MLAEMPPPRVRAMAIATFKDMCIDANDPQTLATFWGRVLGLEARPQAGGDAYLSGPTSGHRIWVNKVPEPKTVKHRMHLDVNAGSVEEIERLGATVLDADSYRWTVMADPEGGEFCVFVGRGRSPNGCTRSASTPTTTRTASRPGGPTCLAPAWWMTNAGTPTSSTSRGHRSSRSTSRRFPSRRR